MSDEPPGMGQCLGEEQDPGVFLGPQQRVWAKPSLLSGAAFHL